MLFLMEELIVQLYCNSLFRNYVKKRALCRNGRTAVFKIKRGEKNTW